ncbi:hypothetical protein MHBO_002008, partial [Bonamia ostreae]
MNRELNNFSAEQIEDQLANFCQRIFSKFGKCSNFVEKWLQSQKTVELQPISIAFVLLVFLNRFPGKIYENRKILQICYNAMYLNSSFNHTYSVNNEIAKFTNLAKYENLPNFLIFWLDILFGITDFDQNLSERIFFATILFFQANFSLKIYQKMDFCQQKQFVESLFAVAIKFSKTIRKDKYTKIMWIMSKIPNLALLNSNKLYKNFAFENNIFLRYNLSIFPKLAKFDLKFGDFSPIFANLMDEMTDYYLFKSDLVKKILNCNSLTIFRNRYNQKEMEKIFSVLKVLVIWQFRHNFKTKNIRLFEKLSKKCLNLAIFFEKDAKFRKIFFMLIVVCCFCIPLYTNHYFRNLRNLMVENIHSENIYLIYIKYFIPQIAIIPKLDKPNLKNGENSVISSFMINQNLFLFFSTTKIKNSEKIITELASFRQFLEKREKIESENLTKIRSFSKNDMKKALTDYESVNLRNELANFSNKNVKRENSILGIKSNLENFFRKENLDSLIVEMRTDKKDFSNFNQNLEFEEICFDKTK